MTPALSPAIPERINRRLSMALVSLSLIFSLVAFTLSVGETGPAATHELAEGSSLRQIQFGSIFLAAIWLAWQHRQWTWMHLKHANPFLIAVVVYCFASMLWSVAPLVSIKRTALLVGLLLIGLATAPPVGDTRLCSRAMMFTITGIAAISAVVALALPNVGVDFQLGGAWRGILWQKNVLGSITGFGVILWLRECLTRDMPLPRCLAGLVLCFFVLVMYKSTTSLIVTVLGCGIYLALRRKYLAGRYTQVVISMALILTVMLLLHFGYVITGHLPTWDDLVGPITGALNKSSDFTGRGEIWKLVLLSVERHPIWGIGYGGFWLGDGSASQYIKDLLAWMPATGHQGYIDILNELGAVGLGLTIAALLWHFYQLGRLAFIDREEAAIHFSLIVLVIVSNFSESQLLADVAFQNIYFFYSSLNVSAILDLHRKGALPAAARGGLAHA